jgi:hypothetical protein
VDQLFQLRATDVVEFIGGDHLDICHEKCRLPGHEVGSFNIFANLGLPRAEEHQLKAALVV